MVIPSSSNSKFLSLSLIFLIGVFLVLTIHLYLRVAKIERMLSFYLSQPFLEEKEAKLEKEKSLLKRRELSPPDKVSLKMKIYTITVTKTNLSPVGMYLKAGEKIELRLRNLTDEKIVFQSNPELNILQNYSVSPKEESSFHFTAPQKIGEYKFFIKTSQTYLEGFIKVI